jgi:hypothetical protein
MSVDLRNSIGNLLIPWPSRLMSSEIHCRDRGLLGRYSFDLVGRQLLRFNAGDDVCLDECT